MVPFSSSSERIRTIVASIVWCDRIVCGSSCFDVESYSTRVELGESIYIRHVVYLIHRTRGDWRINFCRHAL